MHTQKFIFLNVKVIEIHKYLDLKVVAVFIKNMFGCR